MHSSITWEQWAQQLSAYIELQKQRIDKLEETVTKLQTDLSTIKDQKRFHIDKIEYNFDQLKVEKLDGTLTIGISPGALDKIEDFTVNGTPMGKEAGLDGNPFAQAQATGPNPSPSPTQNQAYGQGQEPMTSFGIQQEVCSGIEQYLQQELQTDMRNLENKYQQPLDDDYKAFIIDDIRKQLDTRIQHYVNQYRGVGFKEPIETITTSIMEKTKQDIVSAIDTYISSLPRKEGT
ncbi:spore germination protein GerPC [Paenibacillus sp. N3.4]|uniref:spore germination protein GerPC n=1 Tax=Paenibacillus sp. N3.4 TaxID=2603222 RepID=UPI00164F2DA4|nr:spore germination protein GerPC [Paenibacillus sp. N3.4]